MAQMSSAQAEQELVALMRGFDQWRQTRPTRHAPIPDPLWDQAARLQLMLAVNGVDSAQHFKPRETLAGREIQGLEPVPIGGTCPDPSSAF